MISQEQINLSITAEAVVAKQIHRQITNRCDFFSLPLEIREIVYEHAFGTNPRYFCCKDPKIICVAATLGAPPFLDTSTEFLGTHDPHNRGLPWWITTCKQIYAERLKHFLRTRTFTPLDLGYDYHYRGARAKHNPLIFTTHKIRNIAIPQRYYVNMRTWRNVDMKMG